jgi:hypothetical protein
MYKSLSEIERCFLLGCIIASHKSLAKKPHRNLKQDWARIGYNLFLILVKALTFTFEIASYVDAVAQQWNISMVLEGDSL